MIRSCVLALALVVAPVELLSAQQAVPSAVRPTAAPRFNADACDSSYRRGEIVARSSHSTGGWRAAGFASGVAFSFLGVAGATVIANSSDAAPDTVPAQEVSSCYRNGYSSAARSRNRSTALKSALVGMLVLPTVYIIRLNSR